MTMDEMRVNVDGSPWKKFSMSFSPSVDQLSNEGQLDDLQQAIYRMAKGDIEYSGIERPCIVHHRNVWRDAKFLTEANGTLTAELYVCCKEFGEEIGPSVPKIEAFIKRKLKLPG
jgi:hypothetical protein